jgi:DNA polymerase III epsilon subunit-like protein
MQKYAEKTKDAIFCAYNVSFDWGFVNEAFRRVRIINPMSTRENHSRLDLLTLAWQEGLKNEDSLSLKNACKIFGVPPEPEPHSALNGAMTAYELFKKIT